MLITRGRREERCTRTRTYALSQPACISFALCVIDAASNLIPAHRWGVYRVLWHAQRVRLALEVCDKVECELSPGSVVFFHCNTLHCSGPNRSDDPRWALICCYNALSNTVSAPAPDSAIRALSDECVLDYGREQLLQEGVPRM